jgi:hypothetical protein
VRPVAPLVPFRAQFSCYLQGKRFGNDGHVMLSGG